MAPFTHEQLRVLEALQASEDALRCELDPAHTPLEFAPVGLRCPDCHYSQMWAPRDLACPSRPAVDAVSDFEAATDRLRSPLVSEIRARQRAVAAKRH